jgi:hypothetical protein
MIPDVDYVDGILEERNLGEKGYSQLQAEILVYFRVNRRPGIHVFIEQGLRISGTKYRVPDVCRIHGHSPAEQVFTCPPPS